MPQIISNYSATWTNESITYEVIVDTSDCTDISKNTIIGDIQLPDGQPKVDATKNDLLLIGYDRLKQYPDADELKAEKFKYLSDNAQAASDEFASLIDDPVTDGNGHDELRRLLSLKKDQKKDLWATTVGTVKFTLHMIPEAGTELLQAAVSYSIGNVNSIAEAALPMHANGTLMGGLDFQSGLILFGCMFLHAVQGMLAHASVVLDQRKAFLTNLAFNAILAGIAWLRRLARQFKAKRLAGLLSEPGIAAIAETGLNSLPMLAEPPLIAPQWGEAVLTQSEVEAIGAERVKRAMKGATDRCE